MSLISTPYYEITCNGKIDNIRHPDCPSVSRGGFDQEDVVKQALERGWTESGKGHKCPGCSFVAAADPVATVAGRKPRQKSVPIVEDQQFDGQGQ